MSIPIPDPHSIDLEELLSSGKVTTPERKGLSHAEVAHLTDYYVEIGFDLRMLGKMIGKNIKVTQINRRSKGNDLLGVRWEVTVHGIHAVARPPA